MPDANTPCEWDHIAVLIEQCRAEREACARTRDHFRQSAEHDYEIYTAIRERLLAGVDIKDIVSAEDPVIS